MAPVIKAVIFDIGGVVAKSPLIAVAAFERELRLPKDYINCAITGWGTQGAWQRFERGELGLTSFYGSFSKELSDVDANNRFYEAHCDRRKIECPTLPKTLRIDGRELFGRMMRTSQTLDPDFINALKILRTTNKYKIIALTNNYALAVDDPSLTETEREFLGWSRGGPSASSLRALFDDYVDSSEAGMRKPEPAFYRLALERNHIRAEEAVFLDDLGMNLKPARALGMHTIHVPIGGGRVALGQLGRLLELDLLEATRGASGAANAKL